MDVNKVLKILKSVYCSLSSLRNIYVASKVV
jgi:hypothetical protein